MPLASFEPTILPRQRPQTQALDRAVTGIGNLVKLVEVNLRS